MSLIPSGFSKNAAGGAGFYDHPIEQSLRFNDDDSAYLSRTPSSAGNRKTWTWSGWVKINALKQLDLFAAGTDGSNWTSLYYDNSYQRLTLLNFVSNSAIHFHRVSPYYRDTSAWYHVVVAMDTTQATAVDRVKFYINGEQQTSYASSTIPQNYEGYINTTNGHRLAGSLIGGTGDCYLAEVHFIDGTALDASSFGETKSGVWIPKAYSGSYGTNGFYLPFNHDYSVEGFSATTYKGNSSNQYIGGVGFEPDLVWIKSRNNAGNHAIYDSVRGATINLISNLTDSEYTYSTGLNSFESDGFNVGNLSWVNSSANNYVAWCWDAGSGSPVSNTDGSITSTVKASTTYGFSIVSFTTTSGVETTGHGLSSAPEMIITKKRDGVNNWFTYHTSLGATKFLYLNEVNGAGTSTVWNDTAPTSSVFTTNASQFGVGNYIAYCFHSVSGYSKIGSYTGAGANTSVTTGFKPAFVMLKNVDDTSGRDWFMLDNTRDPSIASGNDHLLRPNTSGAEDTTYDVIQFDDTGFTLTGSFNATNQSGSEFIYMAFADKREAAFWLDQSGNNNDFENNNLTESDISLDSPTNNFATLNPLVNNSIGSFAEGNLKTTGGSGWQAAASTWGLNSGKHYFEANPTSTLGGSFTHGLGVTIGSGDVIYKTTNAYTGSTSDSYGCLISSGTANYYNNASSVTAMSGSYSTASVMQVAIDVDNGKCWLGVNNNWIGGGNPSSGTSPTFTFTAGSYISPHVSHYNATTLVTNFGQDSSFAGNKTAQGNTDDNGYGDFYYAPPTGYLALCTANLEVPDAMNPALDASPQDYFNTVLWTATNAYHEIRGVGFKPDFVWGKKRSAADNHALVDVVRGSTKELVSNSSGAEYTNSAGVSAFVDDGFNLVGTGSGSGVWNGNAGATHVAWCWKTDNTSGVSNTDGSITSTVSANTDAGFSIVSYTGNGTTGSTIGHGLGVAPAVIITKDRSNASRWAVYHHANTADPETDHLRLNETTATIDATTYWNDTAPTSTVFTVGTDASVNYNGDNHIAYCWAEVEGFSKFGSYTGNSSTDGPFVYTGFRPAFVMVKRISGSGNWWIADAKREPYNEVGAKLFANDTLAEQVYDWVDFTSNGFKLRDTETELNYSGDSFSYMAFAENPFKYSTAR